MGEPDLFVSTEEEVEIDADTAAAIDRGLRDADEGKLISSEEVRKLLDRWKEKYSTRPQP
jgi:predicted transcriptional regulator